MMFIKKSVKSKKKKKKKIHDPIYIESQSIYMNASPSKAMPTSLKLMVTITIYFLRQKMKKKYITMLVNGNSSATKEKMEMYNIPENKKELRCLYSG